jgi:hypothetical protein
MLQIEDGDIICFQKALIIDEEERYRYRYPHVRLFLEYVRNRQVKYSFTLILNYM